MDPVHPGSPRTIRGVLREADGIDLPPLARPVRLVTVVGAVTGTPVIVVTDAHDLVQDGGPLSVRL